MNATDKFITRLGGAVLTLFLFELRLRNKPALYVIEGKPFGFRAVTIPPLGVVVSKKHVNDPDVLEHELEHWRQAQRMGLVGYATNYTAQLLTQGYACMPMEVEARQAAFDATGAEHPIYGIQPAVCSR